MASLESDALMFFYMGDKALIGTPNAIPESERTTDITLGELSQDAELQRDLGLASASLDRQRSPKELETLTAFLLSSYHTDPAGQVRRQEYLENQGPIRILRMVK